MEKKTPHYNLVVIKEDVMRLGWRAFTVAARNGGIQLSMGLEDMQEVILGLHPRMLYKSMTTYDDHRVWQDVYHAKSQGRDIYIKVTYSPHGDAPVISFKEKDL